MLKFLKESFDWIAMFFGAMALVLLFAYPESKYLDMMTFIAGGFCLVYVVYAVYLLFRMPLFDWHLYRGSFLRKVICTVLLMPFLVTCIIVTSHKSMKADELLYEKDSYVNCSDDTSCKDAQVDPTLLWSVYAHFIDPGNQDMTKTKNSRGWAVVLDFLGIFLLNGLFVSSIVGWIDSRKEKWLKGDVRYGRFLKSKSHYVVIGGNDMIVGVVKQIFEKIECLGFFKRPYILIQTSGNVESLRRELFSELTDNQQQMVIVYYGNRNAEYDIKELFLCSAEEVYILGEETRNDDVESYHDTMNMECLQLISNDIKDVAEFDKDNQLVCRVMFEYQTSFNLLQVADVDGEKIKFLPFNYYEMWAQNVLVCRELTDVLQCSYLPLEGFEGIKSADDKFVHLVVVGMSRMGLAMAVEAAHLAHYPNFETCGRRTRITFMDVSMEQEKHFFMGRFKEMFSVARYRDVTNATKGVYDDFEKYPWLNPLTDDVCESPYRGGHLGKDFIDVEWEFIDGSIENPNIQQYLADAAANADAKLTIAICLPENNRAIAAAAYLPDSVYESNSTLQVLVYQRYNDDLLSQINRNNSRYFRKLKAFGMAQQCYNSSLMELSEFISVSVDDAYDKYTWNNMKQRYDGKGFINEDYDYLSGNIYSDNAECRDIIKSECDAWMNGICAEGDYSRVKASMKEHRKAMKRYCKKKENLAGGNSSDGNALSADKPKSARMWSNKYNIYSLWTKCRCMTVDGKDSFNPEVSDFAQSMLGELGKMEHNRWVVEQLLLRYRPLENKEQKDAQVPGLYSSTKMKRVYKKKFAHLDICSNDKLNEVDYNISKLDEELIKILPGAYRSYLKSKND